MSKYSNRLNLLVALVISVCLWAYVISEVNPPTELRFSAVPIEFEGIEEVNERGLVLVSSSVAYVDVTIEGKRSDTSKIKKDDIEIVAEVTGLQEGNHDISLDIDIPGSVDVTYTSAESVNIYLDNLTTLGKPVNVVVEGDSDIGTEVEILETSLEEVNVSGPECNVVKVDHVIAILEAGKVTAEESEFTLNLKPVDIRGNYVSDVTLSETTVSVSAVTVASKEVPLDVSVSNKDAGDYERTFTFPETIIIKGTEGQLSKVEKIKVKKIDLSNVTSSANVELTPILPEGIRLANEDDVLFMKVTVVGLEEKTFTYDKDDITLNGLAEGMEATLGTEEVKVTVKGIKTAIENLKKDNFTLRLDLSGLEEGSHEVDVECTAVEKIGKAVINPETINVNITLKEE